MSELGFSGVHHVTIPVSDLPASIAWYTTCLAAKHVTRFDHHGQDGAVFAVILQLPATAHRSSSAPMLRWLVRWPATRR